MLSDSRPKHIVSPTVVKDVAALFSAQDPTEVTVSKSRSSSFKRVSFGNNSGTVVETFVYESAPTEEYVINRLPCHSPPPPPSTPTKLLVEVVDAQTPACIAPPSEISVVLHDGTVAAASLVDYHQGVATTIVSPQIPSLKKMEDHENPFRPEGNLCTEVVPIIEGFKAKPYHPPSFEAPQSPQKPLPTSPVGESGTVDLVKGPSQYRPQNVMIPSSDSSEGSSTSKISNSPLRISGGSTSAQPSHHGPQRPNVHAPAAPVKRPEPSVTPAPPHVTPAVGASQDTPRPSMGAPVKPTDIILYVNNASPPTTALEATNGFGGPGAGAGSPATLIATNISTGNQKTSAEVQHKMLTPPKAGQVEVVNLDGKKKGCKCCTIQ